MAEPLTVAAGIGWGMRAAGWIASPIFSELFKKAYPYLGFDAPKRLNELETKILLLERVMGVVEESPHRNRLQQLFADLKSAFYEAEEILDDVEYYRLKKQIKDTKMKPDSDVPPRKRDWLKKKLQSAMPSSPLKDKGGGWCSTVKECSDCSKTELGSSSFMEPVMFDGPGIFSVDQRLNPDFYNWNKVYVRYCDGGSFSGDAQAQAEEGSTLHFRGLRIYEAVINELMDKGLANAKQAILTGCSAGGLATLLHCDDFSARFSQEVSVKCLADAGFFLDVKDISGESSFWSVYDGVVHLQVQNVLVPNSSAPDESWSNCKDNIRNCNFTQIEFLVGFRNTMVDALRVVEDRDGWEMFIHSCVTHCQTVYDISWNSPMSPRLGNKTIAKAVGDWYHGRNEGTKEIES